MRSMSGTKLAVAIAGATALTTAATVTAYAHDDHTTTTTTWQAPLLDRRVPLNADVYGEFLDAKLDALAAYANAARAKVAAIPADTVLVGKARWVAKARLAKAARLSALLDAIPDTGAYAPTAAQQAQIAAIQADLEAIVARLKTLLANKPVVVAPVAISPVKEARSLREATKVLADRWTRDHDCDRHWGDWDGDRDGSRWDGWDRDGWDGH